MHNYKFKFWVVNITFFALKCTILWKCKAADSHFCIAFTVEEHIKTNKKVALFLYVAIPSGPWIYPEKERKRNLSK